jgi:hydrogenase nickel incorporation protein HypB
MCQSCGCGLGGLTHAHDHGMHRHGHDHDHSHVTLDLGRSLMEKNDRQAGRNRQHFNARNLLTLNIVSSPGSGKTSFIRETALRLAGRLRIGVIVGDLATDNDAERLRSTGVPVIQITTGTVCHLDAEMVARAAAQLDLNQLDVLVVENVGNLVCPADYDLGEDLRVVLLSTTEGEDKPLKYPPMFHSANVAIITKMDLAQAAGFDRELALNNLNRISHHAEILELSSKTGEGMQSWLHLLTNRHSRH